MDHGSPALQHAAAMSSGSGSDPQSQRRPVWVVSRVYPPDEGGVQTYAQAFANAAAAQGNEVRVFTKTSAGPRQFCDGAVEVIDVGPGSKLRVYLRLLMTLWRARRAGGKPIAIHACTWRAAIVPVLLGLHPLAITVHGREIGRPAGVDARLLRAVLSRAERIVAVSDWTRRHLAQRFPELRPKMVVAWNGPSAFVSAVAERSPNQIPVVLTLCRHVPRKNLVAAIEAAALCLQRGARFRYLIGGRGPETERLRALIEQRQIGHAVQLLGYVADEALSGLYASADVFLHPQVELEGGAEMEGFGI